ncbi:unnamed protein product, partial [Brachionus calyciflorus]
MGRKGQDWRSYQLLFNYFSIFTSDHTHRWAITIAESNDPQLNSRDRRGKYEKDDFYDRFPDFEYEAKEFVFDHLKEKHANFNILMLSKFLNKRYEEIIDLKLPDGYLKRSEFSLRLDMKRWGAVWDSNLKRAYFEVHERPEFENKWIKPSNSSIRIVISHYESTFKSGEVQSSGKSLMFSLFLVQHEELVLFELNGTERIDAIKVFPGLEKNNSWLNYLSRSANCYIEPGKDKYFTNETILQQFKSLFILIKFTKEFKNKHKDIIVDNARTHTSLAYDSRYLFKSPGTNCPYEYIKWNENNTEKQIKSYDEN